MEALEEAVLVVDSVAVAPLGVAQEVNFKYELIIFKSMNKKSIIWIAVLGVLTIAIIWGVGSYNAIITAEENVNTAWSQVENQYQRRADLIPNLVETVKGYAAHESATLEGVIAARAKEYDYIVINDQLDVAIDDLLSIILSERLRINRQKQIIDEVLEKC